MSNLQFIVNATQNFWTDFIAPKSVFRKKKPGIILNQIAFWSTQNLKLNVT